MKVKNCYIHGHTKNIMDVQLQFCGSGTQNLEYEPLEHTVHPHQHCKIWLMVLNINYNPSTGTSANLALMTGLGNFTKEESARNTIQDQNEITEIRKYSQVGTKQRKITSA